MQCFVFEDEVLWYLVGVSFFMTTFDVKRIMLAKALVEMLTVTGRCIVIYGASQGEHELRS